MSVERRLVEWKQVEDEASKAEAELRALGQLAADPRAAQIALRAKELRQRADRMFGAALRAANAGDESSGSFEGHPGA